MRKANGLRTWLLLVAACVFLLHGCGGGGGGSSTADPTPQPPGPDPTTGRLVVEDPITQGPPIQVGGDVDILLVLDTSGSLTDERAKLAQVIPAMIAELSDVASHAISFLLAWGAPGAHGGYEGSGHLYRVAENPYVLDSTLLTVEEMGAAVAQTLLSPPPEDLSADGGEAGLYALNRLLTSTAHRGLARERGFLRPGAALAVIFLSDENDICVPGQVPDPEGVEADARAFYCSGITPAAVRQAALAAGGGAPVLFSGIIYRPGDDVPAVGEKEVGWGYWEAIQLTGGVAASLADEDFTIGARNLGNAINALTTDLQRRFPLSEAPVNPSSIRVWVDGEEVTFSHVEATNEVVLDFAGYEGSIIDIEYRVLDE